MKNVFSNAYFLQLKNAVHNKSDMLVIINIFLLYRLVVSLLLIRNPVLVYSILK